MGRKPIGAVAMTDVERQTKAKAARRQRQAALRAENADLKVRLADALAGPGPATATMPAPAAEDVISFDELEHELDRAAIRIATRLGRERTYDLDKALVRAIFKLFAKRP